MLALGETPRVYEFTSVKEFTTLEQGSTGPRGRRELENARADAANDLRRSLKMGRFGPKGTGY